MIPRFSYYNATENLAAAKPPLETEIEDISKDIESRVNLTFIDQNKVGLNRFLMS